ncbi:zinc-binding dehydrogenase [Mesorhizobium sp. B2-4-9]|uniref:alcohol dehydrogenase catalytic domain-containing protein n=1 Tax=Mesorhizobium sp. B2-4-9 TaxID=2589940 RepID=UPI00112611E9|nr:zinc-binding dehydrogenase [Mesorhizobium sp. B2-4-9]TPL23461.1 zinc-binding dehydrogenase [Mesorhizobium sp. B2-4-9]
MRSVIYHRYGEPTDVLQLTEAPALPAPAKDEVLIRVNSRPVHPGDLLGVRGFYRAVGSTAPVGPEGNRPGFEGAGTVEAVGPQVDRALGLVPGRRVAFFPGRWAWSDKVLVAARFVTPIPDDVQDTVAAQLHVNPLTAAMLVRAAEGAGIGQGDVVVLTAAASQVAKLAAKILLGKGYAPIGIVRSAESKNHLTAELPEMPIVVTGSSDEPMPHGAAATVGPAWCDALRNIANGRPIRSILDPVGGELASTLISRMDGGSLISYGDLSGETINLPSLAFSVRGITISGVSVGGWGNLPDHIRAADLATARDLARTSGGLFAVAAEYDLSEVAKAAKHSERPRKSGTILLTSWLDT